MSFFLESWTFCTYSAQGVHISTPSRGQRGDTIFICYINTGRNGAVSFSLVHISARYTAVGQIPKLFARTEATFICYHFYLLYKHGTKRRRFVFPCTHICTVLTGWGEIPKLFARTEATFICYCFYLLYKHGTKRRRFVFPCTHIRTGPHRRWGRCQNYLLGQKPLLFVIILFAI